MKVVVIAQYNPNMFPALYQLSEGLTRAGAEVTLLSTHDLAEMGKGAKEIWTRIPTSTGLRTRLPWFRAQGDFIIRYLRKSKPDWVIAQHEYLVPTLAYRIGICQDVKIASYFADYHGDRRYVRVIGRLARYLDAYLDICDVRLGWRKKDWPRLKDNTFIIRQAPYRRAEENQRAHTGRARVVFTGSKYVLGLDQDRLSRFLNQLCSYGIVVDWYLPGPPEVRNQARLLTSSPFFSVRAPIEKNQLLNTIRDYDVGLHWAPMAEQCRDPDYFNSAASNKIGEYISAGLIVAHAGNPGLSYLPDEICTCFNPTDPEAGADQLAAALSDRQSLEIKRKTALNYHLDQMNFEAQSERFIKHVMMASV